MTASNKPLGPGLFSVGETGTLIDASCLVNNLKITMEKDTPEPTTKLCGDVAQGTPTYTFTVSGNVDQDLATDAGLHALSWDSAGLEVPFTFTPNTDVGAEAEGVLIIDPLDFGGDEMGADMTSDFEWVCVGKPVITYGGEAAFAADADFAA